MHAVAKTVGRLNLELVGETDIRFTREFNAEPRLVWDAHTRPELLRRWMLGPPGWSMPTCEIDLRVGGAYRCFWRNDETGEGFGVGGEYRELEAHRKIVATEEFDGGIMGPATVNAQRFDPAPGGRTLMTHVITYTSAEHREMALSTGMADGMEQSFARMDELLAKG